MSVRTRPKSMRLRQLDRENAETSVRQLDCAMRHVLRGVSQANVPVSDEALSSFCKALCEIDSVRETLELALSRTTKAGVS